MKTYVKTKFLQLVVRRLVADGLTKPSQSNAFRQFVARLSLEGRQEDAETPLVINKIEKDLDGMVIRQWWMKLIAIGALLLRLGKQWAAALGLRAVGDPSRDQVPQLTDQEGQLVNRPEAWEQQQL